MNWWHVPPLQRELYFMLRGCNKHPAAVLANVCQPVAENNPTNRPQHGVLAQNKSIRVWLVCEAEGALVRMELNH